MGSKNGEGSQMNEGGQKGVKWGQKFILKWSAKNFLINNSVRKGLTLIFSNHFNIEIHFFK